jgi:hypothetical protein
VHYAGGAEPAVLPGSGIYVGTKVKGEGIVGFVSPCVPDLLFSYCNVCVEFTEWGEPYSREAYCTLTLKYIDGAGGGKGQFSPRIRAKGDVFKFSFPEDHLDKGHVFPLSLHVQAEEYPILIRGAWLEFPYKE